MEIIFSAKNGNFDILWEILEYLNLKSFLELVKTQIFLFQTLIYSNLQSMNIHHMFGSQYCRNSIHFDLNWELYL